MFKRSKAQKGSRAIVTAWRTFAACSQAFRCHHAPATDRKQLDIRLGAFPAPGGRLSPRFLCHFLAAAPGKRRCRRVAAALPPPAPARSSSPRLKHARGRNVYMSTESDSARKNSRATAAALMFRPFSVHGVRNE